MNHFFKVLRVCMHVLTYVLCMYMYVIGDLCFLSFGYCNMQNLLSCCSLQVTEPKLCPNQKTNFLLPQVVYSFVKNLFLVSFHFSLWPESNFTSKDQFQETGLLCHPWRILVCQYF